MRNLTPGVVVRLKGSSRWHGPSGLGTLIKDEGRNALVMTDGGELICAQEDFSVCRDQSPLPEPMRSKLPYGKWTCSNGREVLFNRDYKPIWERPNFRAAARPTDRDEFVPHDNEEHFFTGDNPPWRDKVTLSRCEQILKSWGIA